MKTVIMIDSPRNFKTFAYYSSQIFWILYLVFPIAFAIIFPKRTNISSVPSKTGNTWNSTSNPFIFSHISDTHVSPIKETNIKTFFRALQLMEAFYKVRFAVHTGDLVDNIDSLKHPKYGRQDISGWKSFKNLTKNLTFPLFEVAGNHDMFGIKNHSSQQNYFSRFSKSSSEFDNSNTSSFQIHTFKYKISDGSQVFETLNINQANQNTINQNTMNQNTMNQNIMNSNTMNQNTMNQNTMNQNTINQNTMNQNTMNQNTINQNTMNSNTINQNTMNQNTINQNTMNQNIMNQNIMNQNTMNQNTMNQNIMNQNTMNQNTMNQNIMNQNTMNQNTMNQNIMNQNTMNQNTMNQNTMNQNTMNQNIMNQNIMNQNTMNQNIMNQNIMNQNIMNQNTMNQNTMNQNTMNQNIMNQNTMNQNTINQSIINHKLSFSDKKTSFVSKKNVSSNIKNEFDRNLSNELNIIALNVFNFPTARSLLLLFSNMSKQFLDNLEKTIEENPNPIVMAHYPVFEIHSAKSSKGRTFEQIVGSSDIRLYLCGHAHPYSLEIQHHGEGNMEIVAPSNSEKFQLFGLVSIDNGRLMWHQVDIRNPMKFMTTHPISKEQISIHTNFQEKDTEIRVIRFNSTFDQPEAKISFSIKNSKNRKIIKKGELKLARFMDNSTSLYSAPLNIEDFGEYTLELNGDYQEERNFIVDSSTKVGNEVWVHYMSAKRIIWIILVVEFIIFMLIVTPLPFNFLRFEKIENWIEGIDYLSGNPSHNETMVVEINLKNNNMKVTYWLLSIFFGFLLIRTRYQRAPLGIKIMALFAVYSVLFIPTLEFNTEGDIGIVWVYGVLINKVSYFIDYSVYYAVLYLTFVCYPMIAIISSMCVYQWNKKQLGDLIFVFLPLGGIPYVIIRIAYQASGKSLIMFSPQFVILPLLYIIIFIVWGYKWRKSGIISKNVFGNIISSNSQTGKTIQESLNSHDQVKLDL